MPTPIQYPCNLRVYRFEGERTHPHMAIELKDGVSLESMLKLLALLRKGLPFGFGASLTDATGRNIKPVTPEPGFVYLLTSESPTTPGIISKVYTSQDSAKRDAVILAEVMIRDVQKRGAVTDVTFPAVTPDNFAEAIDPIQDWYGTKNCYIDITETPLND